MLWALPLISHSQTQTSINLQQIIFADTQLCLVTDSFRHNVGTVGQGLPRLEKYFMLTGEDTLLITRAFTGDPHYICKYPNEPLIPGEIYSFTVCFYHRNRIGRFNKAMGFNLSNGDRVVFFFKGKVEE